jgi:hypothetical protein
LDQNTVADQLFVMPKSPQALLTLPTAAVQASRGLVENLAIARNRRSAGVSRSDIETYVEYIGTS